MRCDWLRKVFCFRHTGRSLTVILIFLMQTKSRTKFRKEILSSKIFTNISNNDIKIIKKMSSDKL